LRLLESYVAERIPIVAVSCEKRLGLERVGETLFKTLDIIRVYTKESSAKDFSQKPFTLKRGSTLQDLARSIHSDFEKNFAFAKVWSKRLVFSPQKVGLGFALEDGDAVEIHVK